jgi:LysM repeat protein
MNRTRFTTLSLVCIVSLALLVSSPLRVTHAATVLGTHVVQRGETLYCLGRGYGVLPSAIASANGLSAFAHLKVGQVLDIPDAEWARIPSGPVCAPQFVSPYSSATVVTPAPVTSATPTSAGAFYVVQRGDTLWRIGLRYGVTVYALKVANGLRSNLIYVGQVLIIPGASVSATPTPMGALPANVQITSVSFDGAVAQVESDEYAVITNRGGTAVNLAGWRLNAGDAGQDFVFPSFDLQPGQSCRVYTNEVHPEACGFSFGSGQALWNNGGDCGYLYDAAGNEVSRYCY